MGLANEKIRDSVVLLTVMVRLVVSVMRDRRVNRDKESLFHPGLMDKLELHLMVDGHMHMMIGRTRSEAGQDGEYSSYLGLDGQFGGNKKYIMMEREVRYGYTCQTRQGSWGWSWGRMGSSSREVWRRGRGCWLDVCGQKT